MTEIENRMLSDATFQAERAEVLKTWPSGGTVDFDAAVAVQAALPPEKRFALALAEADAEGRTLLQPRAGVALIREHEALLNGHLATLDGGRA